MTVRCSWAHARLTTIGEACRAVLRETLGKTIAWVVEQAQHGQSLSPLRRIWRYPNFAKLKLVIITPRPSFSALIRADDVKPELKKDASRYGVFQCSRSSR